MGVNTGAVAASPASTEIEIKLSGRPDVLEAAFADLGGGAGKTGRVVSRYHDTHDGRLWRKGFTLRLRQKPDGHELTLKQEGNGALARGEWTTLLAEPRVDLALLPGDAPRAEIGLILPEELSECFRTDVSRTKKTITAGAAEIEVSLDIGKVVAAGGRVAELTELELELLGGPAAAIPAAARKLLTRRSLSVGTRSKAARGVALSRGSAPEYAKACRVALDAGDTLETAVRRIVAATAAQIAGNLACAADGREPEGVHQLRVALRRLRSALSLFRQHLDPAAAGRINSEARAALRDLGTARDLDVLLTETLPVVHAGSNAGSTLDALTDRAEAARAQAYLAVRRRLAARPFNRMLLDLLIAGESGGLVRLDGDAALKPVATRLLAHRHRKVLKLGRNFAALPTEARHEVRIALKKLRYACDFFQTLFPGKVTQAWLARMEALQDDLGGLNDAAVAGQLVDQLAARDPEAKIGAALVKGWFGHRLGATEPHMVSAWRRFERAHPFWRH